MECVKVRPSFDVSSPLLLSSSLYRIDYRRSTSRHSEEEQESVCFTLPQTPSRTPGFRTPSSLVLPPTWKTPFTTRTPRAWSMAYQSTESVQHFDLLSYLPPEVSISILHYLTPKDLCRACLVCRNWYQLSQHPQLRRRRRKYIRSRRAHFTLSKENYCNGTHTPARSTQRTNTSSSSVTAAHHTEMTSTSSPLSTIQAKSCHKVPPSSAPPSPPSSSGSLLETTTPAVLLDNVKKLSLDEGTAEIRRCLFPDASSPPHPPTSEKSSNGRVKTLYTPIKRDSESVVGRRSNKSRLRRL